MRKKELGKFHPSVPVQWIKAESFNKHEKLDFNGVVPSRIPPDLLAL